MIVQTVPTRSQKCAKSTRLNSIVKSTCSSAGIKPQNTEDVFLYFGHVMGKLTALIARMNTPSYAPKVK